VEQLLAPSIQQLATDAVIFAYQHSLYSYRIPAVAASLLLLVASLLRPESQAAAGAASQRRSDLLYLLALAVFLVALRWPVLALGDLEGDESVAVSAALTRYLDPGHGLTLFTGSAGPLLTYSVAGVGLLGFRIDYGASKLVSLLLITASSAILYLTLRTFSEARTARIALLPLLAYLGLGNARWTLSYCSEQWINLLLISMLFFLLRLDRRIGRAAVNLCGMGLALGLVPLVKWQGIPMAALVVACAVAILAQRHLREPRKLAAGLLPLALLGLAPILVWCAIQWIQGSLGFFFDTYFAALFTQATSRYKSSLLERLIELPDWGFPAYSTERWFLVLTALFWVPAAFVCLFRRPARIRLELALASLLLAVTGYAVLQPGGRFTHYMNLLLQAYALLFMLIFCRWAAAVRWPALAFATYLVPTVLLPMVVYFHDLALPLRFPPQEVRARSLDALRSLHISGSPMIQWGWVYAYYVITGTSWGTRTGGSHEILEPFFPNKSIFVADFVAGLESGRAPVFLDTATEGAPSYAKRALFGHETVPEVAAAVRRNYFPCAEFQGARLFLHRQHYRDRADILPWCAMFPRWHPPEKGKAQAAPGQG
jgi:hypothetical protein